MRLLQLICRKDKDTAVEDVEEKKDEKHDEKKGETITIMASTLREDLTRILENVSRRHKVNQAAIMDFHGNVLAITSGWNVLSDDRLSLQRVLTTASTHSMYRLSLFGDDFLCLRCEDAQTIMGHSKKTVMTAHATRKCVVVGLAPAETPGSCLHEMKRAWVDMEAQGF
ncbi:hypothetical protein BaRGS_00019845 [Batillaria attramentaria]|uniref:Roadblock/LAMTOR2 domain-containing protein n=1 Tax=Batillaria attramentaria TaxID=370345 RepID=A0ABD0KNS6_9CAEN